MSDRVDDLEQTRWRALEQLKAQPDVNDAQLVDAVGPATRAAVTEPPRLLPTSSRLLPTSFGRLARSTRTPPRGEADRCGFRRPAAEP